MGSSSCSPGAAVARPKPVLSDLPLAHHGGPDGEAEPRYDFSVNSNPFGPPPELLNVLAGLKLSNYPDPTERAARRAAATFHAVSPERVVLGSAAELIYRLAACFLDSSRRVLIATPTFGEYARASLLHGSEVHTVEVYARAPDPEPRTEALLASLEQKRPTLAFLCQPNNPTGHAWPAAALAKIADRCEELGTILVIDAAYLEMSRAPAALPENAVWLVPLTKTFALAGLRVGYAVAPLDIAATLRHAAPPWPVGTLAQEAVRWCRSEAGAAFIKQSVPVLLELHRALQGALSARGFGIWASTSSFFLLEAPANLTSEARRAGFRLRDTTSLGLPGYVRVAAQTREANDALLRWLFQARACR